MASRLESALSYLGAGDIERGAAAVVTALNERGALDRSLGWRTVYGRRAIAAKIEGYRCARAAGLVGLWTDIGAASDEELAEYGIELAAYGAASGFCAHCGFREESHGKGRGPFICTRYIERKAA